MSIHLNSTKFKKKTNKLCPDSTHNHIRKENKERMKTKKN